MYIGISSQITQIEKILEIRRFLGFREENPVPK